MVAPNCATLLRTPSHRAAVHVVVAIVAVAAFCSNFSAPTSGVLRSIPPELPSTVVRLIIAGLLIRFLGLLILLVGHSYDLLEAAISYEFPKVPHQCAHGMPLCWPLFPLCRL